MSRINILEYLGQEVWQPVDELIIIANDHTAMFVMLSLILPQW